MSSWKERLVAFRLISPDFDGTEVLEKYRVTGKWNINQKKDMNDIRKDSEEFATDEEAKNFLTGDDQSEPPVPRK